MALPNSELADLDAAVAAEREARDGIGPKHPDRTAVLHNLGHALQARFERTGAAADLVDALAVGQEAVDVADATDARAMAGMVRVGLANALMLQYTVSGGDLQALRRAVAHYRDALARLPADHPDRVGWLSNLSVAVRSLYEATTEDPALLDEAVAAAEQAVAGVGADDADRGTLLFVHARALQTRQTDLTDAAGVALVVDRFWEAAQLPGAPPVIRAQAAAEWGRTAAAADDPVDGVAGLRLAVEQLQGVVPRALRRADQEHRLARLSGMASDAAAAAVATGDVALAVRLLEQGRAVLLGQALDTRTDLAQLQRVAPADAETFSGSAERLGRSPARGWLNLSTVASVSNTGGPTPTALARFLVQGSRADMEAALRADPSLLGDGVEEVFAQLLVDLPDACSRERLRASAQAHLRALRAFRGLRAELVALAGGADRAAGVDPGAAVEQWRAVLRHAGMAVADVGLSTAIRTEAGAALLRWAPHAPAGSTVRDDAVRLLEQAVDEAPTAEPRRRAAVNLAAALREHAAPTDLDRAADLLAAVLAETADGADDQRGVRGVAAATLGHVESDRFQRSGDPRHLDAAEEAYQQSLVGSPPDRRPARLCHLAAARLDRWRWEGRVEALRRAVATLEDAVRIAGESPSRVTATTDLAVALMERYDVDGDVADLHQAVDLLDDALRRDLAAGPGNLVVALTRRYAATGAVADLDRLVELHPSAGSATQRSASLLVVHDRLGGRAAVADAVTAAERELAAATAVARPAALTNLAAALSARYDATGQVADLDTAVDAYQQAVDVTPPRSPRRPLRLTNLADALRDRAQRLGHRADLDRAIDLLSEALTDTRDDAPSRPARLAALATAALDRYRIAHRPRDLHAASELSAAALHATPPGIPDRPARLGLHAACRHEIWRAHGDPADLDTAVRLFRECLTTTSVQAPMRFRHRQNLADALADHADERRDPAERAEALRLFRTAFDEALTIDPWAAVAAARNRAAAAARWHDWPHAAHAALQGQALVSALVSRQQVRRHREGWLRDAQQLPAESAAALTRLGRVRDAVAALDAGRAVLLAGAVAGLE